MKKKDNKKYMWLLLGGMFIVGLLLFWFLRNKKPCGCHSNGTPSNGGEGSNGGGGTPPVNNVVLDTSPIVSKLDELKNELTNKGTSNCGC